MRLILGAAAVLVLALLGLAPAAHATFLPDYTAHETSGNRVIFHCGTPVVVIEWLDARVFRMSLYQDGIVADDSSLAVLPRAVATVPYSVNAGSDSVSVSTSALTVTCRKHPFRVRVADAFGTVLLDEPVAGGMAWNGTEKSFRFAIGDDHLYGLGERAAPFDRRGLTLDTYNQAIYGYGTSAPTMNLNIPFLTSSRGWGLLFDNTWPGSFDLANSTPGVIAGRAEAGPLRLYFIQGPDPGDVLERYTWLTGRQPLPPRWALGYLQSKYGYHNRTEVESLVDQFHSHGLPLDAVILDLYWYGQPSDMGRMTWDTSQWPNPAQMISNLLATGVRTVLIEEPYLVTSTSNYATAAGSGLLGTTSGGVPYAFGMWAGTAGLVDFTKAAAADWWWGLHLPLIADGVAGWWLDLGEPETHPDDMVHASGSARAVHDVYNLRWLQSLYDRHRASGASGRAFLLTRSGFAGMQRTGAVSWSGDVQKSFPALAAQVPMLLGMGLSGVAWHNSDIGGYTFGPTTPELYVRWMQFGTFCPVARAHGSGQDTEPWAFGATAEAICRKFLKLRQRLLPYSYTLARENTLTGRPLARPLLLEYPQDPQSPTISDEYLWGRALLVAPVTSAGATSRAVYLPAGRWTNYWTNQVVAGSATLTVPAPLEQMPLFVRGGSILPLQNSMPSSGSFRLDTLLLDIFPADTASFDLYEDDGVSYAYETGAFATTSLSFGADARGARVHIGVTQGQYTGRPSTRTWLVQIRHVLAPPVAATAGGVSLAQRVDSLALAGSLNGWWYDAGGSRVQVKVRLPAGQSTNITVDGVALDDVEEILPASRSPLSLRASPNPVTHSTTLRFSVSVDHHAPIDIRIFDIRGREVANLSGAVRIAGGEGAVACRSGGLPQGIYWVRLRAGDHQESIKLAVLH